MKFLIMYLTFVGVLTVTHITVILTAPGRSVGRRLGAAAMALLLDAMLGIFPACMFLACITEVNPWEDFKVLCLEFGYFDTDLGISGFTEDMIRT